MEDENLQTEIEKFKEFINRYPKLRSEIRKNGRGWQELYEQWVLLGEEDEHWQQYKEKISEVNKNESEKDGPFSKLDLKPDLVKQVLKYTESIDVNKLQSQVQQLSKTIGTVQEIVNQYQKPEGETTRRDQPLNWFTD